MIKAIVFDWGGVLIDDPVGGLIEYCANSLGINLHVLKDIFSQYQSEFERGLISENELWKVICSDLKIKEPTSNSLWKDAVRAVFKDKKEIFQIVQNLKKSGYKIGFLSNTEIPTMEYFYDKKYERYFDVAVFSCAEKTVKPEEKIYLIALKKLQVKPQEAIFIDDKPEYIEVAKKVGSNGIVFKTSDQLKKELALFSIDID